MESDGQNHTAIVEPMFTQEMEIIDFDFCVVVVGCNFGAFHERGEYL